MQAGMAPNWAAIQRGAKSGCNWRNCPLVDWLIVVAGARTALNETRCSSACLSDSVSLSIRWCARRRASIANGALVLH